MPTLAFMNIGPMEIAILAVLGLLIFGKRLPEVGRSLGRGIVEFKKGLSGLEDEIDVAAKRSSPPPPRIEQKDQPAAQETQDQKHHAGL
jgi:sec-independent protein translocase protein TatA